MLNKYFAIILFISIFPLALNAQEAHITQQMKDMTRGEIKTLVVQYLGEEMLPVIQCESGFLQYIDGIPLRSKTHDIGIAQVNVEYWGIKAMELGFDIYTPIGNLKMGRYIKSIQGIGAWMAIKSECYKKLVMET